MTLLHVLMNFLEALEREGIFAISLSEGFTYRVLKVGAIGNGRRQS